jgi:hypothetical protein
MRSRSLGLGLPLASPVFALASAVALASALALVSLVAACGGSAGADPDGAPMPPDAAPPDAMPPIPNPCPELGLEQRAWHQGPYGVRRNEIADDFTVELVDGSTWSLFTYWSGCETYVFVPDTIPVSDLDPTSIWSDELDLSYLLLLTPRNVHYFFVSRAASDGSAETATSAMQTRIDDVLAGLGSDDREWWRDRLHVIRPRAGTIGNWLDGVLAGHGRLGFAIDRLQRIRGVGMLADVTRFDPALQAAMAWPWKANLMYVMYEAIYMNAEAAVVDRLAAESPTVVTLWDGEVLQEFAEIDVAVPDTSTFNKLELEITMTCPNVEEIEFGNCGAWDYIASLGVRDETSGANVELARFITAYHRETHWVVDASRMLPLLAGGGGMRHFRWDFAPPWNPQPTATRLTLRFSHVAGEPTPVASSFLFGGGAFDSTYDDAHPPIDVAIPADAQRVELVAITTGHGAATNQCAEFCNHEHEFTVDGQPHTQSFPQASTQSGCMLEVENGMVPNQGGTWWFGRGGWCPGQQVTPWIVDVTDDVTPGATATIEYRGLYAGVPPPDGSGNIVLVSYLVFWR